MQTTNELGKYGQLWLVMWPLGVAVLCVYVGRVLRSIDAAAKELQRATQANIVSQLMDEYASERMLVAMRGLLRWKERHPNNFVEVFMVAFQAADPEADEVDLHRRIIMQYFIKVRIFSKENNFIPQEFLNHLARGAAYYVLMEVIKPMQNELDRVQRRLSSDDFFGYCERLLRERKPW